MYERSILANVIETILSIRDLEFFIFLHMLSSEDI